MTTSVVFVTFGYLDNSNFDILHPLAHYSIKILHLDKAT